MLFTRLGAGTMIAPPNPALVACRNGQASTVKIALTVEAVGARHGGAEKYAGSLLRSLADAGHEVHVVARVVDAGELPARVRVHPVRLRRLPGLGFLRSYRFAQAAETILRSQRFDLSIGLVKVWHQHVYIAVGGAHPASLRCNSRRYRSPLRRGLWWLSKAASLKQWVFHWIERKQFHGPHAPHVIVPAQWVAEHFERYHGVARDRITVIPWGLDAARELPDRSLARADFRRQHGLEPQHVAVLFVARNYELKGLEPLLRALAPVARRHPETRLLVCGSDRDQRHRRLAARLKIGDQVRFLGFVDDVQQCFAGSDVFAFPTFYDPCSLVVLEAMRAGLPVITTRTNGAAELVHEEADGFVIESAWDVGALGDRLARLIADRTLRERMGARAWTSAARFSLVDRQAELLAALTRAAADPAASPTARRAA
jgi:UDP-glucose:(heptosyl)LPS alpha-1,3-glucosyltransferase